MGKEKKQEIDKRSSLIPSQFLVWRWEGVREWNRRLGEPGGDEMSEFTSEGKEDNGWRRWVTCNPSFHSQEKIEMEGFPDEKDSLTHQWRWG